MDKITQFENFGVWYDKSGYPNIYVDGKDVKLHVYIWERVNGPKPPKHDIHHIDYDKSNYNLENLRLVTLSQHRRIHAGWVEQDGEWIAKPCNSCELVLPLDKFYYVKTREIHSNFCKHCHDKKVKERTQKIPDKLKKYYHDRYIRLRDENKK